MWYSDGDGEFATPISNSLPQVSRYIEHLFAYINMPILIIDLSKKTFVPFHPRLAAGTKGAPSEYTQFFYKNALNYNE